MWFVSVALAGPVEPAQVSVPAAGRREAVFTVDRFGRYAIGARSPQGTAIQVVDLMTGPGSTVGAVGERDGRIDLFLDPGRVKVVAWSDPAGQGQAELRVSPFTAPADPPARLVEDVAVATTLTDLTERSWWIDVGEARTVAVEAAGRYLGDLRLWRDGGWLVDTEPRCSTIEPIPGQPWTRCALVESVEPGLYLLTAYGGPGRPWTEDATASSLHLRWGVPLSPSAGRITRTLGDAGYARFRMPEEANLFHLGLPDVAAARIQVAVVGADPLVDGGPVGTITDESRRPVATVQTQGEGDRVVTVTGPPGQAYTLTWFDPSPGTTTLGEPGRYFVTTLLAADAADVPDPTAVLYRHTRDGAVIRSAAQGVILDKNRRYERQFNLAERTQILLDVTTAGPYVAWVEGTPADLRIQPFLVTRPAGYQEPKPTADELAIELDVGLYVLDLVPREPGIATLQIGHDSWASRAKRAVSSGKTAAVLRPVVQLPSVVIERDAALVLQTWPPRIPVGVVVRELPIDPRDALPVGLLPGEVLEIPIDAVEPGVLTAAGPDGKPLPLAVDGAPELGMVAVGVGAHTVRVRNPGATAVLASVGLVPDRLAPGRPLPALDAARLRDLPVFPELVADRPLGFDLESGRSTTVRVALAEPGLQVLETTGLLATRGAVRTRTRTSLASADANGVGRNFQIATYLRSGDYQLTTWTTGQSAGHLGIRARRIPVQDGGALGTTVAARSTVRAEEGVRYTFSIPESGTWNIRHAGRTGVFRCRLEDDDGWPVTTPDRPCDVDLELEPGDYVVVGLPERVETRRITTLRRLDGTADALEGHGPHPLSIGVAASHVWVEPADGGADRAPDVWELVIPAEVTARVTLSAEMAGELTIGETVARLVPGESWSGALPRGTAKIEVRGARRGTGVPYALRVDTSELVAGSSRTVSPSVVVPVAVASAGVYTLTSQGNQDVRARLVDADGRVVAANDDRPDDWNFQLSPRLAPGRYTLTIDAVADVAVTKARPAPSYETEDTGGGGDYGEDGDYEEPDYDTYDEPEAPSDEVTITMRAPREVDGPKLVADEPTTVSPGNDAVLMLLDPPKGADVLVARASSAENVGVAIEVQGADGWRGLGDGSGREAVAVARVGTEPLRVRVWSEDTRGGTVEVRAEGLKSNRTAPGALASGKSVGNGWGAVRVEGDAGQYALTVDRTVTWACGVVGAGCARAEDGWVAALDDGLVLVKDGGEVQAQRVELTDGQPSTVRLWDEPQLVDLAGSGPVVVMVRGASGQPGAAIPGGDGSGVVGGAAVAVSAHDVDQVRLWDALDLPTPLDVRVTAQRLTPAPAGTARDGRTSVTVPGRGIVSLGLPGVRDVQIALDAGLVLATSDGRVAWADRGSLAVHARTVVGKLVIANPSEEPALAVVDVLPGAGEAKITEGAPHERVHGEAETWLIAVEGDEDGVLRVHGAATATLVRSDGRVERGETMAIGPGGNLSLVARPGPVLAWVEPADEPGPARNVKGGGSTRLDVGGTVPLKGDNHRIEVHEEGAYVVQLRSPCPAVAEVRIPQGYDRIEVLDTGSRLDLWLPTGEGEVTIRALAETTLYGEVTASSSPVTAVGDGLGPEILLAPGDAATFSLHLDADRTIGFGARATAERVEATLLDATGRPLASGVVAMRDLVAGDYLIRLSQPGGTTPVRTRVVVAGIVPPSKGPPDEVVRGYVQLANPELR